MNVNIKLEQNGIEPKKQHTYDACFDCYSADEVVIPPKATKLVSLGFSLELPEWTEAQIRPRSGMSKNGIQVQFGTVDSNYRGIVMACVYNSTTEGFVVKKGDRICQMAIKKIEDIQFSQVSQLSESERGSNGFGSTGV